MLSLKNMQKNNMLFNASKSPEKSDDKSKKNIPVELTAYGTTPSGKPRLFVCQACTRAFARLEHLRRHERSHTKEKPFTCGVCQRKFSRRDLLLRHAQKLHAGCDDAITRLRRKSVKRPEMEEEKKSEKPDDVKFNLNLFDSDPIHNQLQQMQMHSRSHSLLEKSPSSYKKLRKNSDLAKNVLMRGRGVSFSAQSGQNYAANIPEFNDLYSGAENVEFLTPQLAPSHSYDESWLNNLLSIPGMSNSKQDKKLDLNSMLYMLPTVTMQNDFKTNLKSTKEEDDKEVYGYSFYDIPESMSTDFALELKLNSMLTPIKHEYEEDHNNGSTPNLVSHSQLPYNDKNHVDFDLNFMNDIGDLTNELDVSSKFMPNGYSFYGDNSVSSSNIDSPGYNSPNNYLNQLQLLNIENTTTLNNLKLSNFSKTKLFTPGLRNLISKALNKYPINGILNPTIPPNEKLEFYLECFVTRFLSSFPFIHPSKLNELEIMMMTGNEDFSNESSRACLPLLVATVGALLLNNKSDSEHLYEALRRTIHIYLETRKQKGESKSINPLWLIQSLTLSVFYGLFSDNENNVFIVIRQLNALNSLVKTSIREVASKKNKVYFSISKQEEDNLNVQQKDSLFESNFVNEEVLFNNSINLQSQSRIIFMIYRLTGFLLIYYNIPLTLSINDLTGTELPSKHDEIVWGFKDFNQYQEEIGNLAGFKLAEKQPVLYFKDLLLKISKNSNLLNFSKSSNLTILHQLSCFGFVTLIHGIFEINQFNSNLNTVNIANNLTLFLKNSPANSQLVDYIIVTNFVKISSILDFKLLKQQSWLKNQKELIKNFETVVDSVKLNEFSKIDKILDYALISYKSLLFKCSNRSTSEDFLSEDSMEEDLDEVNFENLLNVRFFNSMEFDELNLILAQSLFHVSVLTSILLLKYLRYPLSNYKLVLTGKFKSIVDLLQQIQERLELRPIYHVELSEDLNYTSIMYILNISELILLKIHQKKLNFVIFEKLAANLEHIRKFLVAYEHKYQ